MSLFLLDQHWSKIVTSRNVVGVMGSIAVGELKKEEGLISLLKKGGEEEEGVQ